ncbi:MAG: hypothetical protein AAF623_11975 [Planctomycetota bacterium]
MLKNDFIPVAIDQWYERKQQDAKGEFYRKIASQGPRNDFSATTQGRYVCTPDGKLLGYNNNRGSERLKVVLQQALQDFDPRTESGVTAIASTPLDSRYDLQPPEDGVTLRTFTKVLNGYEYADDQWQKAFEDSIARDNVWLAKSDVTEIKKVLEIGGPFPERLAQRLARFHFNDNTRGEPNRWNKTELKMLQLNLATDGKLTGIFQLENAKGNLGFEGEILGEIRFESEDLIRFDMVAKGMFRGHGWFAPHPPKGKFPVAIAFTLADGTDVADRLIPHGAKGNIDEYLK